MEHEVTKVLERDLLSRGWHVAEREASESGREDERWRVSSTWSPQGAGFVLTFCIDWHPGGARQIWKVEADDAGDITAAVLPREPLVLYLGGGWMDRCEEFVRSLDHFRSKTPNQTSTANDLHSD